MTAAILVLSGQVPGRGPCLAIIANRAYRIEPGRRASPLRDEIPVSTRADLRAVLQRGRREAPRRGGAHHGGGQTADGRARARRRAVAPRPRVRRGDGGARGRGAQGGARRGRPPDRRHARRPVVLVAGALRRDAAALGSRLRRSRRARRAAPHQAGARRAHGAAERSGPARPPAPLSTQRRRPWLRARSRSRALRRARSRPTSRTRRIPVTPDRLLSATTTDWIDRPVAACYEPIDVFTFPRAAFLIRPACDPPQRPVHELSVGAVLREDLEKKLDRRNLMSPRMYNAAPAGLAVCRLEGAERVSLWNMHAEARGA